MYYFIFSYGEGMQFVYRHENFVNNPKDVMSTIIDLMDLKFENTLVEPTIAGNPWLGNSHYGPVKGISKNISKNYFSYKTKYLHCYVGKKHINKI